MVKVLVRYHGLNVLDQSEQGAVAVATVYVPLRSTPSRACVLCPVVLAYCGIPPSNCLSLHPYLTQPDYLLLPPVGEGMQLGYFHSLSSHMYRPMTGQVPSLNPVGSPQSSGPPPVYPVGSIRPKSQKGSLLGTTHTHRMGARSGAE